MTIGWMIEKADIVPKARHVFLDQLIILSDNRNMVFVCSFWENTEDAERYDCRGYRFIAPVEKLGAGGHFREWLGPQNAWDTSNLRLHSPGLAYLRSPIGLNIVVAGSVAAVIIAAIFWIEATNSLRAAVYIPVQCTRAAKFDHCCQE